MEIQTPSGYKVSFKNEEDLNYGERRKIQRAMMSTMSIKQGVKAEDINITGDMIFEAQEATLRVILKKIIDPQGKEVTGDLFDAVMSWQNEEDGNAVMDVVTQRMGDTKKKKIS